MEITTPTIPAKTQTFRLLRGSYSRAENGIRQRYVAGRTVQLNKKEQRLLKGKIIPIEEIETEDDGTETESDIAVAAVQVMSLPEDYNSLLELIRNCHDMDVLSGIISQEQQGKKRTTIVNSANARLTKLQAIEEFKQSERKISVMPEDNDDTESDE